MPLLAVAFSLLVALQDAELGNAVTLESVDCSFRPPAKWSATGGVPPTLVKLTAPKDGLAGGRMAFIYVELQRPVALDRFAEETQSHFAKEFQTHRVVDAKPLDVDGAPGRLLIVQGKTQDGREVALARALIQRGYLDYFIFEATADSKEEQKMVALLRQVLATLAFGLPLSKEEEAGRARFQEALRALERPKAPEEIHFAVRFGKETLGGQRLLVREKTVDGEPGYAFESEMTIGDRDGAAKKVVGRGEFARSLRTQRVEYEEAIEAKDKPKVVFREVAELRAGKVAAEREIDGQKVAASFAVPEGTVHSEVAEILRGWLAVKGAMSYAFWVLSPFRNEPRVESLQIEKPEMIRAHDGERLIAAGFAKVARARNLQYFFEQDGTLYRLASGRSPFEIRRCTREEYKGPGAK